METPSRDYNITATANNYPAPNQNITLNWGKERYTFDNGTTTIDDDINVVVYYTQKSDSSSAEASTPYVRNIAFVQGSDSFPSFTAYAYFDVDGLVYPSWK